MQTLAPARMRIDDAAVNERPDAVFQTIDVVEPNRVDQRRGVGANRTERPGTPASVGRAGRVKSNTAPSNSTGTMSSPFRVLMPA